MFHEFTAAYACYNNEILSKCYLAQEVCIRPIEEGTRGERRAEVNNTFGCFLFSGCRFN